MPSNFSSGTSGVKSSKDMESPSQVHLTAGQNAAAKIIDSGVLGEGPYNVQIAGTVSDDPGSVNQLTVTVTASIPVGAPPSAPAV